MTERSVKSLYRKQIIGPADLPATIQAASQYSHQDIIIGRYFKYNPSRPTYFFLHQSDLDGCLERNYHALCLPGDIDHAIGIVGRLLQMDGNRAYPVSSHMASDETVPHSMVIRRVTDDTLLDRMAQDNITHPFLYQVFIDNAAARARATLSQKQ